ncbi:MAG: type II secretion system protein M [Nitrospinae bacterium]|nr:type II secretion system protein M [Nitrospinota bacterium]
MMKALERLSERDRKVVYAGAAASLAIVLYFFVVEPLYYGWRGMDAEIARTAEHVARYKAAVAGTSNITAESARYDASYKQLMDSVFINETDALSAAQMTELVRAKAQASGIAISSSKTEKVEPGAGFRSINVSVLFNAPLTALSAFLREIQNDQKKLLIREVKIAAQKEEYGDQQEEVLSVRMTVTGLRFVPNAKEMQ